MMAAPAKPADMQILKERGLQQWRASLETTSELLSLMRGGM